MNSKKEDCHLASGTILFHGSKKSFKEFRDGEQRSGYYPGFYTSWDRDLAANHGGQVTAFSHEGLRIYDLSKPETANALKKEARAAGYQITEGSGWQDVEYLKKAGYDAIMRGKEVIVFDTKKLSIAESVPDEGGLAGRSEVPLRSDIKSASRQL